jgi:hypothetical protein
MFPMLNQARVTKEEATARVGREVVMPPSVAQYSNKERAAA